MPSLPGWRSGRPGAGTAGLTEAAGPAEAAAQRGSRPGETTGEGQPARRGSRPGETTGEGQPARRGSRPGETIGAGQPARRGSRPGETTGAGEPARRDGRPGETASPAQLFVSLSSHRRTACGRPDAARSFTKTAAPRRAGRRSPTMARKPDVPPSWPR